MSFDKIVLWTMAAGLLIGAFDRIKATSSADIQYKIKAFNTQSVDARKNLTWQEVLDELESAQSSLRRVVESVSERGIENERRFGIWTNTLIRHYRHHISQIRSD